MALQGQVSALQEAQGEQQKAEAADQDPGKAGSSHRAIAVLFAVIAALIVLAAVVLIGMSYQSGEGDGGSNVVVFNMPSWLIAVIVGVLVAAVAACAVSVVHMVRVKKAKGRKKEQTDKNK